MKAFSPNRLPLSRCLVFLLVFWLAATLTTVSSPQAAPQKVHLTLLGTTDLHGNLMPFDDYANRPANRGLAKIATLVRTVRAEQPHVLLLDSGDTIEGSPLAYYFARKEPGKPNPVIVAMNALGYDAIALGNHDFNFGLKVLWKAKREAHFPILAANLRQEYRSGPEHFQPYVIKSVAGVRVGIVGFITPGVPRWELPKHYRGYEFEPIVDAARRVIPEVRKQSDLVVVIAHSGLERSPETGQPLRNDAIAGEDAVHALATEVPGIDVILFGHSHLELSEAFVNGVLLVQARNWGQSLARVDVDLERTLSDEWHTVQKHSTTLPVTDDVPPDPEIVRLVEPYHRATQAYLDVPIAESARALNGATARCEDHPLVDLIHRVQMEYGHADVSLATLFYPGIQIPAGRVTRRQMAALYLYENTLYTVQMTGAQLKQALEHAASFYPSWPLAAGQALRLPGYNADSAEGVGYKMDLTQPPGQRIRDLTYKGKPLAPTTMLRVALNNYRYSGGGGYDMLKGLPIVHQSREEIRELLIQYVSKRHRLLAIADANWEIVPREAREAILEEARALAHAPRATGASSR